MHQKGISDSLSQLRVGKGQYQPNDDEKVYIGLMDLVIASQFPPERHDVALLKRNHCDFESNMLQPKLMQPKKAKRALLHILQTSGSPTDFKRGILATQRSSSIWLDPPECQLQLPTDSWKLSQKTARASAKQQRLDTLQVCSCCGKFEQSKGERFAACSRCKFAVYCSNECQVSPALDGLFRPVIVAAAHRLHLYLLLLYQRADWKKHKPDCQKLNMLADFKV